MSEFDITELSVCTVCIHLIANGEFDDGTDAAEKCAEGQAKIWGENAIHLVAGGHVEDCDGSEPCGCTEPWFSWSSCDGCGETLGGDRFHAAALIPQTA
ncbi:hypothetical protein ORV05_04890 [Amycolatopsis cynarae]|uniref:Uncharacterized protein n=1 Tax=Amycolatopsis cynarae TaxID=2995223 RepID=A0ABY7B648_9PSEU|nr:hypothetical protein [Amycolatopsis sp. HUAS 11-8]WAL67128.1 hypothetical protein ORV05_04890 [Amycolatopsis sp. HUAS 11-8]